MALVAAGFFSVTASASSSERRSSFASPEAINYLKLRQPVRGTFSSSTDALALITIRVLKPLFAWMGHFVIGSGRQLTAVKEIVKDPKKLS